MAGHVLIVGASLAGLRTAECLRAGGHAGPITVCGDEPHMPYNRPPLSKEALIGGRELASLRASLAFRLHPALADVRWLCGRAAIGASLSKREVRLADGETLPYDILVAATGLRPRRLPLESAESRRFVLRTVDDAVRLRSELEPGRRLVIVGGGFIGCEVASIARKLGLDVTVVEPLFLPMVRALGASLATAMQDLHETAGVVFRLGVGVRAIVPHGHGPAAVRVELSDGTALDADLVVEAVGSLCNVEWLAGQGLDLSDGLLCDDRMRVQGRANLYAVGDVARFPTGFVDGQARRVEHWCIAGITAKRAAESIIAECSPQALESLMVVPSFWSDQQGVRIQSFGMPALGHRIELLEGSLATDRIRGEGGAVGYFRGSRLIGVVCVAMPPARLARFKGLVTAAAAPVRSAHAPASSDTQQTRGVPN